jgi:hypothetical protein
MQVTYKAVRRVDGIQRSDNLFIVLKLEHDSPVQCYIEIIQFILISLKIFIPTQQL